jgi:hypothetical protein
MTGITLNIRMKFLEPLKRGISNTFGQIFVRKTLIAEVPFVITWHNWLRPAFLPDEFVEY